MKHSIITRINFKDLSLMSEYLKITKEILIPAMKSQTVKDFEWIVLTNTETLAILKYELDYPFTPIFSNTQCYSYLIENNINIQTRHDCDDYMSSTYVETIQKKYFDNIEKLGIFLIQTQPTKLLYPNGPETSLPNYHNLRCSMHLTLCQKNVNNHIFEHVHGNMYKVTNNVITLPEGYTKWVIHGNNISVNPNRKK